MKPTTGYYRQLIANIFPMVRIAMTHTPIIGCTKVDSKNLINFLEKNPDPFAQYYVDGLKSGAMVAIVEGNPDQYFKAGELFFKS